MKLEPLLAAVVICAIFCLPRIVIRGDSAVPSNRILIRIPAEGLMAVQVSDSIEPVVIDSLSTLKKDVSLQSISRPGELLVTASFSPDYPMGDMLTRIQRRLFAARNRLPYQAGLPLLIPLDPTTPFLCLAVDFSDTALSQGMRQITLEAKQLQEELRRSGLVRRVSVLGIADQELALFLDRETLVQRQVSPQYISAYLQQCLFDYYAGNWQNRRNSSGVNMCSSVSSVPDLKKLRIPRPASSSSPKTLVLEDIAEIKNRTLPPRHRIFGGEVLVSIFTATEIQVQQQIALYTQLCTTLMKNDAIESWHLCGGHVFSTLRLCALCTALFCVGLLLTLYLSCQLRVPSLVDTSAAATAVRLYSLVWSLLLLWHALGPYPCTLCTCTGAALALPLAVLICHLLRMLGGWRPPVRNFTLSAFLPATWLLCALCTGVLLFRALLLLPQPRVLSIELPSEQQPSEFFRKYTQQLQQFQISRNKHVCGVLPLPHEFSRTENAREYWERCAHPEWLKVNYLAAPLREFCSPSPFLPSSEISERAPPNRQQRAPLTIELKSVGHDPPPVTRREIHSHIDLTLNGQVIGTLPAGTGIGENADKGANAVRRIPVRLFYGHPFPRRTIPWQLKQLPIFIDEHKAVRLEQLCWLHTSKGEFLR